MVRSDLVDFTYENSESLREAQSDLIHTIRQDKDSFFTVCQGITETTYILNAKFTEDAKSILISYNGSSHEEKPFDLE